MAGVQGTDDKAEKHERNSQLGRKYMLRSGLKKKAITLFFLRLRVVPLARSLARSQLDEDHGWFHQLNRASGALAQSQVRTTIYSTV